ncbi:hypothetical protein BY996DRAFT_6415507 [Phakopsora pachyrhizi]|nr:hypothetical protein BY996DRAFT_6415507 [Phakopsora pachyrhizi]
MLDCHLNRVLVNKDSDDEDSDTEREDQGVEDVGLGPYGNKIDFWSLGISIYEHRRLIAKVCSEMVEASKPESRAIPEELKDNTSNNVLKGDFTEEPEAFTISQNDELDKASQSLSIDAKPNRKKSSGPVISKLKKLILNHYQLSIIQK